MLGQSPLSMMRPQGGRTRREPLAGAGRRRRLWLVLLPLAAVVVLACGWSWLWYFAATTAERSLADWVAREEAAGRVYRCAAQGITGFPFRLEASCSKATAELNSNRPPYAIGLTALDVITEIYYPTRLVADLTGPLTLTEPNQTTGFVANWSQARMAVHGLLPTPDRADAEIVKLRVDRAPGAAASPLYAADSASFEGNIVAGSALKNPVIETVLRLSAASAPTLHALLAEPLQGDVDAVWRGFKDLLPKPMSERFREMHDAGGQIEIKALRLERADTIVVGTGTLSVNAHGKLDGLLSVGIVGIEHIVPLLGIDKAIGQGIDRLAGAAGQPALGIGGLDRLLPGLSGVVRQTATVGLIDNLKKMGQPTEIDKKPGIVLPLRVSDGSVYLGMVPLGEVPPLF